MKVRSGFVSNSSTSSFCILGVEFDDPQEILDCLKIEGSPPKEQGCTHSFDRITCKHCPECGEPAYYDVEVSEWLEEEVVKFGLEYFDLTYGGYGFYIGTSVTGSGQEMLDKLAKTNKTIKQLCGKEASIHRGAYNS